MYYKEEELNRFWEVENNVCGCVMKEEKHSLETFDLSDRGNYYIGLCTNSQTLFCRIEKKEEGHRYLGNLNPCSLIFAKDGKEERYNTLFPKVAWGITAWLLFHYQYDSDLEELYNEDDSRDDIFARYKDLCYTIHKARYAKRYNHYSKNNPKKIDELDELFITTHIQQEREYISKFSHHECMTEEYYKAILQCANEYIQWVEDSKAKKRETIIQLSNDNALPYIYHADNLNFVLLLEHLKDQSNSRRKIVNKDITTEDFVRRILSADLSVFPQKVYRIFFLKQISDHYINDGEKALWYKDAMRKAGITERDLSQQNESENTFIQEFRYSKFKVKQVDTTKNNNCR